MSTTNAASGAQPALRAMLALTFSTGVVDAVGYLGLNRVFAGNMTGNVVVLGMSLSGAGHLPVLGPTLALAGFLTGAAIAGRALRGYGSGWTRMTTILLWTVAVILSAVTVTLASLHHPPHAVDLLITTALGLAMGAQAGTARRVGVPDVTTVVVTSTITGLAADSWFGGRTGTHTKRRATAAIMIIAGAGLGALVLRWHLWAALAIAALVTIAVAEHETWSRRRREPVDLE